MSDFCKSDVFNELERKGDEKIFILPQRTITLLEKISVTFYTTLSD